MKEEAATELVRAFGDLVSGYNRVARRLAAVESVLGRDPAAAQAIREEADRLKDSPEFQTNIQTLGKLRELLIASN